MNCISCIDSLKVEIVCSVCSYDIIFKQSCFYNYCYSQYFDLITLDSCFSLIYNRQFTTDVASFCCSITGTFTGGNDWEAILILKQICQVKVGNQYVADILS